VELVDASSGAEMWTQRYDRPLRDIFVLQDQIVGKVVTTLGLIFKLNKMEIPYKAYSQPTENLEAFDDFLRGVEYFWRYTKDDNARARRWLEKTIEIDPNFARAYSVLGGDLLARCGISMERESSSRLGPFFPTGTQGFGFG
jgi:hypothetical protein